MGDDTNKSTGGYITYYGLNGRPKDYTGTKYGMLSCTFEGTGCIYGETGYSVNTQKINTEALENIVLTMMMSLSEWSSKNYVTESDEQRANRVNALVEDVLATKGYLTLATLPIYNGGVE